MRDPTIVFAHKIWGIEIDNTLIQIPVYGVFEDVGKFGDGIYPFPFSGGCTYSIVYQGATTEYTVSSCTSLCFTPTLPNCS
jgi:hypothetical protein